MTKPSADTWTIDPWVHVVPSFLCASLFQSVCVRVGDDVFIVATWNLLVRFFTRYGMPLLRPFSCRPSVSPEPSAARMPLLILWLSPTGYCGRERQNSLFVLAYTSSCAWFLYSNYYLIKKRQLWDGGLYRKLIFASWAGYFDLVWRKTRMRCGLLYYVSSFCYWGACWSKKYSYSYDITRMYVRTVTFDFALKYVLHFLSPYVGTW